ncbi:MAG: WYL domain-containing protein [Gammaproteobacteria bacterium]|nr:WYL domain-containing protein [Gammaproteobacteria bacterium]
MASQDKFFTDIKWATRKRLQYIETMAYYTGVVTRSDVAKAFGLSDAAATKDLKYYGDIAPDNLFYKHNVFGFVPTDNFVPLFSDLTPSKVLPLFASNLAAAGGPYDDDPIYGISMAELPMPNRLPSEQVVAQITRAIHQHRKLEIRYLSMSDGESQQQRIIEPHSLVNTGNRWHVRAYNEATFDFRDFVLSRFEQATQLDEEAESSAAYDDDWVEEVSLELAPHPNLDDDKRQRLLFDYGATGETIVINIKRALLGYMLQGLSVDTSSDHSQNPNRFQLIVVNRDEIEMFASWVFN